MYLVDFQVKYRHDDTDWSDFYDPKQLVWGSSIEQLKTLANQWVGERDADSEIDRRYFIRRLEPQGTAKIVYCSWTE
jgi:hypothetical protein